MCERIIFDLGGREVSRENYDPDDQPQNATTVQQVKAEAGRRISALFGGKLGTALIYAEINALAAGSYPVAQVGAIRAASDAIEARLDADPYLDPATQPDWPEAL